MRRIPARAQLGSRRTLALTRSGAGVDLPGLRPNSVPLSHDEQDNDARGSSPAKNGMSAAPLAPTPAPVQNNAALTPPRQALKRQLAKVKATVRERWSPNRRPKHCVLSVVFRWE